jgi:hypothetical protein
MRPNTAPYLRRLRWWLRGLWPDRNPLRRRCDRAEAAIFAGLLAAFLIGAPPSALAAGRWAYGNGLRIEHAELAARHRIPAVLLTAAQQQAGPEATARAWWSAPDGVRHTGQVPAAAGSAAGTMVTVWVNTAGRVLGPPLSPSQVMSQAVLAAMVTPCTLALALWWAGALALGVVDRRRLASWDAEWRATGPKWSRNG